jgi:hypothetical protein
MKHAVPETSEQDTYASRARLRVCVNRGLFIPLLSSCSPLFQNVPLIICCSPFSKTLDPPLLIVQRYSYQPVNQVSLFHKKVLPFLHRYIVGLLNIICEKYMSNVKLYQYVIDIFKSKIVLKISLWILDRADWHLGNVMIMINDDNDNIPVFKSCFTKTLPLLKHPETS